MRARAETWCRHNESLGRWLVRYWWRQSQSSWDTQRKFSVRFRTSQSLRTESRLVTIWVNSINQRDWISRRTAKSFLLVSLMIPSVGSLIMSVGAPALVLNGSHFIDPCGVIGWLLIFLPGKLIGIFIFFLSVLICFAYTAVSTRSWLNLETSQAEYSIFMSILTACAKVCAEQIVVVYWHKQDIKPSCLSICTQNEQNAICKMESLGTSNSLKLLLYVMWSNLEQNTAWSPQSLVRLPLTPILITSASP